MTRTLALVALMATAAVAACDNSDHTIVAGPDIDNEPVSTENVVLPASIVASESYRCKDNSIAYVDWLSDDSARIKKTADERGTTVTKGEDGSYSGEGQSLSGAPDAQTITVNGQSCKK